MFSLRLTILFLTTFFATFSQHVQAQGGGTGVSRFEQGALIQDKDYDAGGRGPFPNVTYHSSDHFCPLLNKHAFDKKCSNDSDVIFLSLYGSAVEKPSLVIIDQQGRLVWQHFPNDQPAHFKTVKYKGEDHLSYWNGKSVNGVTMGSYHLLNSSYDEVHNIHAANNLEADIHAFSITPDDNALFTVYERRPYDLTPWSGPQNGWIWDSGFQEINVVTGELVFQWKAADHLGLEDVESRTVTSGEGTEEKPLDWIHMNSVTKDQDGNYLVSGRYLNAVAYISGTTGDVIWQLGGESGTLKIDSSSLPANGTEFTLHHTRDASFVENGKSVMVFDNYYMDDSSEALVRGLKFDINPTMKTAKLVSQYVNNLHTIADRGGGSLQPLPNGNALMSYGGAPVFTEFASDGTLLCDTHIAPVTNTDAAALSHRIHKGPWRGMPNVSPKIKVIERSLYITWNGAITVQLYSVEGRDTLPSKDDLGWTPLGLFQRGGFETFIHISDQGYKYYRVKPYANMARTSTMGTWIFDADGVREAADLNKYAMYSLGSRAQRNIYPILAGLSIFGIIMFAFAARPRAVVGLWRWITGGQPNRDQYDRAAELGLLGKTRED